MILKKIFLILAFVSLFNSCIDREKENLNYKMELLNIFFEPLNKSIDIIILNPDSAEDYIKSKRGSLNDALSARFKSKVYDIDGGKLVELRRFGLKEDAKQYNSLNDLLFCRKVFTTQRTDTQQRIYDVNCSKENIDFLIKKYDGKPILELKEDTRAAIKLNNGQYLIVYRTGDGVLFNSLSDLQYISPFETEDYDDIEEMFISRDVNLYADLNHIFKAELIHKDSIKKYKYKSEKTEFGKIKILSDGRIIDQVSINAFCVIKSKEDFNKMSYIRRSNKQPLILLLDNQKDGLIINVNDFENGIKFARENLSKKLGIKIEKLDYSIESTELLDSVINKYLCDDYFISEIASSVVSYVGDVIKMNTKGKWQFERYESTKFYRAIIKQANGNEIDFIPTIFSEFRNQVATGDFASSAVVMSLMI